MTQSTEKELLKIVVKINNKVQDVNQKIILLTEKVDKGFVDNEKAHIEMKIEKDVKKIKQRVFA